MTLIVQYLKITLSLSTFILLMSNIYKKNLLPSHCAVSNSYHKSFFNEGVGILDLHGTKTKKRNGTQRKEKTKKQKQKRNKKERNRNEKEKEETEKENDTKNAK